MKNLLEMKNITKDFFGNVVLQNVNLNLKEGEILGLVGENGAGKTTLMKILFGMPIINQTGGYQGEIYIDGKLVKFNSPFDAISNGIGMVHQEFSLLPGFTAAENICLNKEPLKYNFLVEIFGERLKNIDFEELRKRAVRAIELLGVNIDPDM